MTKNLGWKLLDKVKNFLGELSENDLKNLGFTGRRHTSESKKAIGLSLIGNKYALGNRFHLTEKQKEKSRVSNIGKKHNISLEGRARIAAANTLKSQFQYGEHNPNWKGGKTKEGQLIRSREDYATWRNKVFKRDNWTCQLCSTNGGRLVAHHIKPFSVFPALRVDLDNGVTLCRDCHKIWHERFGQRFDLEVVR